MTRSWQLNERHYGMTGLRKDEVKEKLSKEMLNRYRRDYDTPPVLMGPRTPSSMPRLRAVRGSQGARLREGRGGEDAS